jgi:hypothetical protein
MRRTFMNMLMSLDDQAVPRGRARVDARVSLLHQSRRGSDARQYQNDSHRELHRKTESRGHREFKDD